MIWSASSDKNFPLIDEENLAAQFMEPLQGLQILQRNFYIIDIKNRELVLMFVTALLKLILHLGSGRSQMLENFYECKMGRVLVDLIGCSS